MATEDLFDALFTLEDNFHNEGYEAGYADGLRQAELEARIFGVEQGYAKFIEMGLLQAKCRLWSTTQVFNSNDPRQGTEPKYMSQSSAAVGRLDKHLATLQALVDPTTMSYDNTDDAVAEFDDRLKRAQAKVKVIERILGQESRNGKHGSPSTGPVATAAAGRAMEDFGT